MPLIASAFVSYAAGLLMGFGGVVVWGGAVAVVLAVFGCWGRRLDALALAGVLLGGTLHGEWAREDDVACVAAVRRDGVATVRLLTPLAPGRTGRGVVQRQGCGVRVRVRVRTGEYPAGSALRVAGRFARRGQMLDVGDAAVQTLRPPGRLARWRAWTATRIDALYGADAPLARALLLADADDIDRAVRDRYADAGIIHMLSVSGLHVGIIAGAVRAMALAARAGAVGADGISLGVTVGFVLFIGAPPPAVRSAMMLVLVVGARARQRPTAPWGIWAVSCAIPLVEPRVVLDLGWQLSVAGMAGLLASGVLARRLPVTWTGWRRAVATSMLATTVASAATAPLVAWVFGRVSLAAVLTNVVAAPLFDVAQPLLFASLVTLPLAPLARALAELARAALTLIDLVAHAGAALPLAVLRAEPDAATAALLGVSAVAGVVAVVGRWWRRPAAVSLGALALAAWWPAVRPGPGRLEVHVLDVGQGDAVAVRTPRGRWLLVDAGGGWRGGDAAASIVWPYLRRFGGDIVYLVMSHPHLDHIGGVPTLLERAAPDTLWDGGYVSASTAYRDALRAAQAHRRTWRHVAAGDSLSFDGVAVTVLAPDSAWLASLADPNEGSVVLRLSYGAVSVLLTGDAEAGEEAWLLARYGDALRADVLKVAHHGSATSSTAAFLDAVRPRVALVSVGTDNSYGHPSQEVLQAFDARGAHLLRTDDDGTIVVATNGVDLEVRANGEHWRARGAAPTMREATTAFPRRP
ncbi:MAG: DNA internalization-related competence protein ComEC/Rec2 [Gemmatimonadetes bacterium]|nr:DNA internalization-related competence protein ComEC/Rec2 [Gemmatimonadota bacterium]